jgi:arginyl-tRNA synthetase
VSGDARGRHATLRPVVATNLRSILDRRLAVAFSTLAGEPIDPMLRRSQRADFQADAALSLARRLGRDPREVATQILEQDTFDDLCSVVEVAGPGFINLTVRNELLSRLVGELAVTSTSAGDGRLGIAPTPEPETVVVDYSAPNVAKEMHVGHLRSTIIGDAVARLLEWLGHTVIRQNHLGDWGTPFGMLIEHLIDIGDPDPDPDPDEDQTSHEFSLGDLNAFYRAARRRYECDEAFAIRSRRRVVLLQAGDEATRRRWLSLVERSQRYLLTVYDRLDVQLSRGDFAGESSYHDQLGSVVDELDRLGLLRESDGARCIFPAGFANREGRSLPLIVRKSDGGFGYDATDLAAIRYRIRDVNATRLIYVVGLPQRQHLQMIFQAAREAGWVNDVVCAEHVGFGSVLGPDGKMFRTRDGVTIRLTELLDEAVARAADQVAAKNPDLDAETATAVARAVGIGAVKYADLSTDRNRDYTFDLDRMLSLEGNTAPYLQYAHARIHSIFRRAGLNKSDAMSATGSVLIVEKQERELAIELLEFEGLLRELEKSLDLHRLCNYLYALASRFTNFYEHCPVLAANVNASVRTGRLTLCSLTAQALALGLELLGITAPDQM